MKHCIIHQGIIDKEITRAEKELRIKAKRARRTIDKIMQTKKNVIDYREKDPALVADLYKKGDKVVLYGAYKDFCVYIAKVFLEEKGVTVKYSEKGCI